MTDEVILEKNIPLPETILGKWVNLTKPMAVGDSLKVPNANVSSIINAMKSHGFKATCRKIDDDSSRLWRVA